MHVRLVEIKFLGHLSIR
jgi:hypothetical protein